MRILEIIDWISYAAEAAVAMACAALSFRRARKIADGSLYYYLLTGFYACICMSDVFFLLTWAVADYPFVFSAGDISWSGGFLFLITAALWLRDEWTRSQRQAARGYKLPALIAPAVCVAFNIVYIRIYPEITFNYLLYGVPTAILSYYALWLFLAGLKGGVQPAMRYFHLAVLGWIVVQLFFDLFSSLGQDYGYAVHVVVSGWIMTFFTAGIYFAADRGAAE